MNILITILTKLKKIEISHAFSDSIQICYEGSFKFFLLSIEPIKHYILEILFSQKHGHIGFQVVVLFLCKYY